MSSPFQAFRKYQKTAMVALVFLSLFAFVVMDSISQMSGDIPPGLMALLLGTLLGGLFWFFGSSKGKGSEYSAAGALLGVLLGILIPRFTGEPPAVRTNAGDLSQRELQQLVQERQIANQFIAAAYSEAVFPAPTENPMFMQFWEQGLRPFQFHVMFNRPVQEDVVLGYLLRQEAEDLGIEVSDEAVNAHIKQATNNKLTREQFREIRRSMNVSEAVLYDILKQEIKTQLALQLKRPRDLPTPHEYWDMYRKLNVNAQVAVAPVPVEPFMAQVKEPEQAELVAFFEQYKNRFPTDAITAEPAFGQPRKVRVAYLQASYEKALAAVEKSNPVSDADIEAYYNENRETLFKNNPLPRGQTPEGDAEKTPAAGPQLKAPDAGTPDEKPSETPPATEAADEKKEVPAEPADEKKTPAASEEPAKEPAESAPADEKAETKEGADLREPNEAELQPVLFEEPADSAAGGTAEEKPADAPAKPADEPKGDEESQSTDETKPAAESKTGVTASEEKPKESAGEEKPAAETKPAADPKPSDDAKPAEEPKETGSLPEYKPLDDLLRADIRDQLLQQRVQERLSETMQKAYDLIDNLSFQMNAPEGETALTPQELSERVKEFAEQEGLRYVVTDPLSFEEFADPEQHALAGAVEASGDPFRRRGVTEMLFGTDQELKYIPARAVDQLSNDQFVYWKIADIPPQVPTLDEPGIRDQVVEAWKRQQAQPLAEKRAEELAEMVRKSEAKDLSAVLGEKTVTGATEGEQITVQQTGRFSWIDTPSAAPTNPMQGSVPRLSDVSGVEKAGPAFMEVVFDDLEQGEVGVAPNADRTVYYVVKVSEKFPASEQGMQALRQQFLQTNLFSAGGGVFGQPTPYDYMAAADSQQLLAGFDRELMMKYDVRFRRTGEPSQLMAP